MEEVEKHPLVICMNNAAGEEITLTIEPDDDFKSFLDKAKSLLGFDVNLNTITKDKPVSLDDNVYNFFINANNISQADVDIEYNEQSLQTTEQPNDIIYILDDGTEINASQIHFDNDDPPVDLTAETIPFIKIGDVTEEDDVFNSEIEETKIVKLTSSRSSSPKRNFANSLPFRLALSSPYHFKYHYDYPTGNVRPTNHVSKLRMQRPILQSRNGVYNNVHQRKKNELASLTRGDILNMFKDPPAIVPCESSNKTERRKHVRKTDPCKPVTKNWEDRPISFIDVDGSMVLQNGNSNCFICETTDVNKIYIMIDPHNSSLKQHKELKNICEKCLEYNMSFSRLKSVEQPSSTNEYIVIMNNQQHVYSKIRDFEKTPSEYVLSDLKNVQLNDENITNEVTEHTKVLFGSHRKDVAATPINSNDDVIEIKDDTDSSRKLDARQPTPDIDDKVIENLDEADEEVKEFLGKYQAVNIKELKCRFCSDDFENLVKVLEHGKIHKYESEDENVYPCSLCDYGYADLKWLKGHLKAAHENLNKDIKLDKNENKEKIDCRDFQVDVDAGDRKSVLKVDNEDKTEEKLEPTSTENRSPIASRTRGANKTNMESLKENTEKPEDLRGDEEKRQEIAGNSVDTNEDHAIKTEVKQEILESSDDEGIWILQTADDQDDPKEKLLKILVSFLQSLTPKKSWILLNHLSLSL